ncbi:MAG: sigma-54-dependent Fis family transcriptional regulator [Deltaproteobacteria bacterium]|jgi:DNA-binding NtrC family response regulator|nr:sigma-54-dependent Fis family transcriptional regulator [Deltaproteobacteria bacterium]
MENKNILVVEDDNATRDTMIDLLSEAGYEVESARNGEEAIAMAREYTFDIVITDLKMPKGDGIQVLEQIKKIDNRTIVIICTGYGTVDTAVKAMKLGAYEYITKPIKIEEIKLVVQRALDYQRLKTENVLLQKQLKAKYKFKNLIGDSEVMQQSFQFIEKIAATNSTVMICGESGTGKELVARAIHYNSDRRNEPMVPVNCGAIPEDLLESELFGYEKGAFTGALKTRIGRFELANGGTVFLDEIGDMSPALQVKILRVLQEHEFERLGGVKSIKVDIRVIAATHRDLEKAVKQGTFREDLYYRLNVIPFILPPLRERGSDIPLLTNHFIGKFNIEKKQNINGISPEALKCLTRYHWPGNVRELENLIERLVILKGEGVIEQEDLPEKLLGAEWSDAVPSMDIPDSGISFNTAVSEFERELILRALKKTNWIKNRAAKLLQLKRTTLVEKIKKIQLTRENT